MEVTELELDNHASGSSDDSNNDGSFARSLRRVEPNVGKWLPTLGNCVDISDT